MVVIIVGREFAVTGLRAVASAEGYALAASDLGKTKMVMEVIAVTALVLQRRFPTIQPLGEFLLWLVVLFALASAGQYFWSFWRRLDARIKQRQRLSLALLDLEEKKEEERDVATR
jgi:CDP-diacylglycerol--glycerol-3-phosphate 3-phosphatidyltransferase